MKTREKTRDKTVLILQRVKGATDLDLDSGVLNSTGEHLRPSNGGVSTFITYIYTGVLGHFISLALSNYFLLLDPILALHSQRIRRLTLYVVHFVTHNSHILYVDHDSHCSHILNIL